MSLIPELAKQHFVNESYLRAWTEPTTPGQEPYVWLFPKAGGERGRKSPKNVVHETDHYMIKLSNGKRDERIESRSPLSRICSPPYGEGSIKKREDLSDDDRATLCVFVAAMTFQPKEP